MKNFYTEEEWNEILKKQEEVLKYDTFTRKQALELGLLIAEITEQKYQSSVAVRIVEDGMDGIARCTTEYGKPFLSASHLADIAS